jgi:hypothetical protein
MHVFTVTEGRKQLGELIDLVKYQHQVIQLGKNGKAEVLLVAIPHLEPDVPVTEINASSPSFAFLASEPELYTVHDLKKRYV